MHPRNAKPPAGGQPGARANRTCSAINFTPAAHTLKAAIIHAGKIGAVPSWAVGRLLVTIGRRATPGEGRALRFCLLLAINSGRIQTIEAERAARCLGGWL